MIPRRLIRTVPTDTTTEVEDWWKQACELHPGWEHVTLRDPVDRGDFPLTQHLWDSCESGAQLADLIRAEELWWRGGFYIDSDYVAFQSFEHLCGLDGVAAWEDDSHIPNAVMGFTPNHPALQRVIELAIMRHDQGTWQSGVGVTTEVFANRNDILLLPPGSFYAVPWRQAHKRHIDIEKVRVENPWAIGLHMYRASWYGLDARRNLRSLPE